MTAKTLLDQLVEERTRRRDGFLMFGRLADQIRDDVRMSGGDIVVLAWILREVEQERWIVHGARLAIVVRAARDVVCLEPALADGAKLAVEVIEQRLTRART